jgi:anti-anti-sigma factor
MTISIEQIDGDVIRVFLGGRLDIEGAAAVDVRMSVLAGNSKFLLADMRDVPFPGSMGLRSIVVSAQTVGRRGGKMVIFAPVPMVDEVLKAGKIDEIIPIFHELEPAIAALR